MPELCMPMKGPMGFDGVTECPSNCPTFCGAEEMMCPGPMDTNGCMGPETCMPMKAGDCYNTCPMVCGPEDMMCPGGMDANGCPMPELCMPMKGPMGFDGVTECPSNCPTF